MALRNMVDWLVRARQEGYAIPAFNVCELQSVRAIVEVCEEERAPCLLQVAETHVAGMEPEYFVAVVRAAAELARVPVALHYDHGRSFEGIMRAIRAGFTSVMIDGSDLPYAENVALTREIVRVAHACGVGVEAELGQVGRGDDPVEKVSAGLTDPRQAAAFAAETGVDALAVAVGTAHGAYRFPPRLDLARLREICALVPLPLVIHGGSQTPGLEDAVRLGVAKVNVFTDLQVALRKGLAEAVHSPDFAGACTATLWGRACAEMKEVARQKLRLLGAAGRVGPSGRGG